MSTGTKPQNNQSVQQEDSYESSGPASDQANAIARMPAEMAILKMENENIMSLAAARPRNHATIKAEIVSQLKEYPSFAKAAIYSKPVGRDEGGQMKFARGLSVRAAEAVAEAYGYCRISTNVTALDDDTVRVEASFTDYQKGRIWSDAGIISKWFTNKYKKAQRHPDDRFYNVVVKAEMSRRIREVILRSVPPGLRSELMEMAERQIDALLDDTTIGKIQTQFANKGVTLEQLEKLVGRTKKTGWTKDDRRALLELWNAIEDGETTIQEAFADQPESTGTAQTAVETPTGKAMKQPRKKADPKQPPLSEAASAAFKTIMEATELSKLQATLYEVIPALEIPDAEKDRLTAAIESHPVWLAAKKAKDEPESQESPEAADEATQEASEPEPVNMQSLLDRVVAATGAAELTQILKDSASAAQNGTIQMDVHKAVTKAVKDRREELGS